MYVCEIERKRKREWQKTTVVPATKLSLENESLVRHGFNAKHHYHNPKTPLKCFMIPPYNIHNLPKCFVGLGLFGGVEGHL